MSLVFAVLFLGLILLIAGLKNVSLRDALLGNFDVPKPASTAIASS